MVSASDRHVEAWRRTANGWTVQDLIGDAWLRLALDDAPLALSAIYDTVAL
jgi:hypothetical protein